MPIDAQAAVSVLYRAHAVGLIRLAYLMLGDRAARTASTSRSSGITRSAC